MTQASPSRAALTAKLREHFGFRRFRPGQEAAVRAALAGRDTLVLMPTGSGKSLCFQLPSLEMEGSTIVVSPLISLMKDQTDALERKGHNVVAINSGLTTRQRHDAEEAIVQGEKDFVYTTPEQLANRDFRAVLKLTPIDLFVADDLPTLPDLEAISPLPTTRLKLAMSLLRARSVVKEDLSGHYHLLQPGLSHADFARFVREYEDLDHRDQLKLQRIVEYAESRTCRWNYLLEHFGGQDAISEACGHCDQCRSPRAVP
jgi:superfamily II DNA helicase RecQ